MTTEATPGALGSNDQLGLAPERAAMRPLEVEFVRGTLHLNGKPAQEWIDLADSEGTRAVNYLRRARKAEKVLRELVALEDMRLRLRQLHEMGHGTDYADYHRLLPMAWDAAREVLGPNVGIEPHLPAQEQR